MQNQNVCFPTFTLFPLFELNINPNFHHIFILIKGAIVIVLLKVALNTITLTLYWLKYFLGLLVLP